MKKNEKRLASLEGKVEGGPIVVEIDPSIDYVEAQRRSGPFVDAAGRRRIRIVMGGDDAGVL